MNWWFPPQNPDPMDDRNQFNIVNRFIGDIEDGKRYPYGCPTFEEADARYASKETETTVSELSAQMQTKASQAEVDALETTVNTKASEESVNSLAAIVAQKADEEDLQDVVNKLNTTIKLADFDNVLMPYYQGHLFMKYNYVPSSFFFSGSYLYILCFNRTSNTGKIYKINTDENKIVTNFSANIYHANSCAFVNNKVFIAKTLNQETGNAENGIAVFDVQFTASHEIGGSIGSFMGVSFDEVQEKLYAWRNNGELYEINADTEEITFIGQCTKANVSHYNQDFCVRDNIAMISSTRKEWFIMDVRTMQVIGYGGMPDETAEKMFILNENEGWEWHDGKLYCIMYTKKRDVDSLGIFCEIGTDKTEIERKETSLQSGNFTFTISDSSFTRFHNYVMELKHPNEMAYTSRQFNTLRISTTMNLGDVYFTRPVSITDCLVCDTLHCRGSELTFNPQQTDSIIEIGRIDLTTNGGVITFGGSNFEYDIEQVSFGTSTPLVKFRAGTKLSNVSAFGTQIASPVERSFSMIGTVPDMMPIQKKVTNIVVPANSTYTTTVNIDLQNSYWNYRAICIPQTADIISNCSENRVDAMTASVDIKCRNLTDAEVTAVVNVFLIPIYDRGSEPIVDGNENSESEYDDVEGDFENE